MSPSSFRAHRPPMKRFLALLFAIAAATTAGAADFTLLDRTSAHPLTQPRADARPTVVALWASDCVYCKRNLRTLAGLSKANPHLRVLTIAAEMPGDATAPEIDKTGLKSERFAFGSDMPEAISFALDPDWRGELPRTYLFDGKGHVQARSGVISAAEFRAILGLK